MYGISLFSHLEPCQHDQSMLVSKCLKYYEFVNFMFQLQGIMQQSHNYLPHLYSDCASTAHAHRTGFFYQFFIS